MDRFSSILILPAVLGALAIASSSHQPKSLTNYRDNCSLIHHSLPVQEDGCTGVFPVLSCYGTCQSSTIPKFSMKK